MNSQSLESIINSKVAFKQIKNKFNKSIKNFDKYRINNDFEYTWKKIDTGHWIVDSSTDITCWICISQAKHFTLDQNEYIKEAYCDICVFKNMITKLYKNIDKYRLNNDFEYTWKKINNNWIVDSSTDITCWVCISQAKHFILDDNGYVTEAYCNVCVLKN